MSRILIVAPDSDLGRSLEFALRAEGHDVTWHDDITKPKPTHAYDCTVLDHHAAGEDIGRGVAFCEANPPVILLANFLPHQLSPWAFLTIQKPLLGQALVTAIRDATATAVPTK